MITFRICPSYFTSDHGVNINGSFNDKIISSHVDWILVLLLSTASQRTDVSLVGSLAILFHYF